ncbi:MAG: hypothetical protein GX776_09025 [Oxalobacter sp.]|nr:hypothetical protein [Oxalobacter sp.]
MLGYDVAVFQKKVFPVGCSPLSCNHLAENIAVNEYYLFPTLDVAIRVLNEGGFDRAEPRPYRLYAVYRVKEI